MKKHLVTLIKGFMAGVLISIGGIIYLSLDNKIIGATFFSIGLLVICIYQMNLYTGKVGYAINNKPSYLIELLLSLIGNYLGTLFMALCILATRISNISEKAKLLANVKLNDSIPSILILSFCCGMLMYIAVNNYKKIKDPVGKYICIFMCVIVFILSGFEHCVANMFYFNIAKCFTLKMFAYLIIMILGNGLGAIFISAYDKYLNK